MSKLVFIWEQTYLQRLPSLPFVLRLFFLQVHQTNVPATASAASDPNTAPTTIPMVTAMHDKLQIIFFSNDFIIKNLPLYSCYGHETFGIQSELNLSSSHNYVSKLISYIEVNRLQCVIISSLRKR